MGCGSLRGGRLFIPYLLPGHYFGIEPAQWLVREGFERELGQDMQRVKWPNFHHGNDFQLSVFGRSFDFIIAQSIFSHAATCQIRRCLSEAAKVMKPRAIFAATYFEASEDYSGTEWVYPECVGYTFEHLIGLAREQGLACARLNWPHPNGQQWVVFFRQGLARISEGLLSAVATSAVPGGGR